MHQLVYCTCPDKACAEKLARHLVEKKLAACVNIVSGITSIYQWQGEIESADECLLLIKSRHDLYPQLEQTLVKLHPYELPEVVAVTMDQALPAYLNWMDSCLD
jgi:periplasmic divalent cation tolerance protein